MPPADNTQPPATPPAPAPEPPKKLGFFAKLFGKKAPADPGLPQRPSQTPPPELNDSPDNGRSSDSAAPDAVAPAPTDATGLPTPPAEEKPPTLDVPPSVKVDESAMPTTAPSPSSFGAGTPAGGEVPGASPVEAPKEDTPPAPKV